MARLEILQEKYSSWQQILIKKRQDRLQKALKENYAGEFPARPKFGESTAVPPNFSKLEWRVELPSWCQDQRNQMTGPADNLDLCIKMVNSGAPGVMLDLEDSMVNSPKHVAQGIHNACQILDGTVTGLGVQQGTVITVRPRGLHLHQPDGSPAAFYDVTRIALGIHVDCQRHPLCFYIPKSESAEEALWWRELFRDVADLIGVPSDWIRCMALVESHPLAYEMEEFIYILRDHILALNLGRWDYMASLIHWTLTDPGVLLPDRNDIPSTVDFFQVLRKLMVETCHKRGILAIGGMTALFPSRTDKDLNERAMLVLEADKKNEAAVGMDGAWTGHPDQNAIAVAQFPAPNQLFMRHPGVQRDTTSEVLRRFPEMDDETRRNPTPAGTWRALQTSIIYRLNYLKGKGASLIDGYMEDLATDRIYRLMVAQRLERGHLTINDLMSAFNHVKAEIIDQSVKGDVRYDGARRELLLIEQAAYQTLESILLKEFDPK